MYGRTLCYLPEEWQNDAEFCKASVIQNVDNYRLLSENMQCNLNVGIEAAYQVCKQSTGHDFSLIHEDMRNLTLVCVAALDANTGAWRKINDDMKAVPEVQQAALAAIYREWEADDYIDSILLGDENFTVAKDFKQLLKDNPGLVNDDNIDEVCNVIQSKADFLRGPDDMVMLINSLSMTEEAVALPDLNLDFTGEAFELPADLIPSSVSGNVNYETELTKARQVAMAQKDQDRDR